MKPIKIKNNWMYVSLVNDNYEVVGKCWIQWRTKYQILITYSLLS